MKASIALLAASAATAMAQSLSDLPACGQTCINNMIGIAAQEFGCSLGDVTCYCTNERFGYGIRDCANESCPNAQSASSVIAFGTEYCASALSSASVSPTTGALPVLTSALASATATGGEASATGATSGSSNATGTGGAAQSTPVSTSALVGTITNSDGSTQLTTTGFSTIYGAVGSGAASAISSATDSAGSAVSSIASSIESAASSLTGSLASQASSAIESARSSILSSIASSAAATASSSSPQSSGLAPKMTGLPVAGVAGMAALFFL